MAKEEILKRIEQNNLQGEELVKFIEKELPLLQKISLKMQDKKITDDLKEKNIQLKKELEYWMKKVLSLEVSLGIRQVPIPSTYLNAVTTGSSNNNTSDVRKELPETQTNTSKGDDPVIKSVSKKLSTTPKEKKVKEQKAPKEEKSCSDESTRIDVSPLDLRVGCILSVKKHPDADSLYVEEIDIGEDKPRTVVSGLVKFIPIEELENRMVVVLCNLKPAKMRGITSEAMVMCASTPEKVEVLTPPPNSVPGDKVICDEYPGEPDSILPPKKKIFEQVAPDLKTDNDCNATYKSALWKVKDKGSVKSVSLTNVNIK